MRTSPKTLVSNWRRTSSIGMLSMAPFWRVARVVDERADGALRRHDRVDGGAHRVLVGDVEGQQAAALGLRSRIESSRRAVA